ncbi:MAG: hypothetical protein H7338_25295 [Candidatus Sericytochromatia bacterium]|nr:hypothetical protein [Candidatus Sericytochromatia bacterium]
MSFLIDLWLALLSALPPAQRIARLDLAAPYLPERPQSAGGWGVRPLP